jgi:replicative DNA helicase
MNIAQVCNDLSQLNFHINSKCKTIQEIEVYARKLKNINELDLLVIDYLQLIKNANRFGNREQEVADISRTLKLLSLELDIPIIGLCQLNRNATRNEPTLADLRESGSIEQDADNVLFLYKEEGQEEAEAPVVILKIAKQRAGDVGKTKLLFKKSSSEFTQLVR